MNATSDAPERWLVPTIILFLASLRLCHAHLLWADEDYHLAAAIHILHGKVPYLDFWYDKPPLSALFYLLIGGRPGWPLRILGAADVLLASYLAYKLAAHWWSEREGQIAALLMSFCTAFYLPSAVIPLAPDALTMAPHLAAIYFAGSQRPFRAGVCAGLAFLINTKAVFVFASCALFLGPSLPALAAGFAAGFAAVLLPALAWALNVNAWSGYREQVWEWGLIYAKNAPVTNPWLLGFTRTLHWLGFHAAVTAGAAFYFAKVEDRKRRRQLAGWIALSFIAVCLGVRFAPHYYFQLLPPLIIAASRGLVLAVRHFQRRAIVIVAALLLIPAVRFGPRYVSLAYDIATNQEPHWSDVAMDLDSRHAAAKILTYAHPGDTLFVWGYRPNLYVYTRLDSPSRFWDSQPLTAVPADRHLQITQPVDFAAAGENRTELALSQPTFVADGLTPFNPALSPARYANLRAWWTHYQLVDQTPFCLIYRRIETGR